MATLLWLQAGACSGNTISLLQAEEPTVVDLLTDFGVELLWHPSLGPELGEAVVDGGAAPSHQPPSSAPTMRAWSRRIPASQRSGSVARRS